MSLTYWVLLRRQARAVSIMQKYYVYPELQHQGHLAHSKTVILILILWVWIKSWTIEQVEGRSTISAWNEFRCPDWQPSQIKQSWRLTSLNNNQRVGRVTFRPSLHTLSRWRKMSNEKSCFLRILAAAASDGCAHIIKGSYAATRSRFSHGHVSRQWSILSLLTSFLIPFRHWFLLILLFESHSKTHSFSLPYAQRSWVQ